MAEFKEEKVQKRRGRPRKSETETVKTQSIAPYENGRDTEEIEKRMSESVSAAEVAQEASEERGILDISSNEALKRKIRNLVSGIYDIQKLRISTGNRIVQSYNFQMGQKPSTKQDDMDEAAQKAIKKIREEYSRVTDAYVNKSYIIRKKKADDVEEKVIKLGTNNSIDKIIKVMNSEEDSELTYIRSKIDYDLIAVYVDLLNTEENMGKILKKEIEQHPMWDAFFKNVKGCGPLMSAVCVAYFDVHKARHVSSFWRYAGLDTVPIYKEVDGEMQLVTKVVDGIEVIACEGRGLKHTEEREYINKDGEVAIKRGITYNPVLRTRLLGVLGTCLLKRPGEYYEKIYRDYRMRLDNRSDRDELTKGHKHNMAMRYMVKQFVRDMWVTWRALEGYEVSEPYEVAKLHMAPHKYNEYHTRIAKETAKKHDEHGEVVE